ncbi:MAG: 30S ribosomal protein S12 methylthiotransferase RimO [Capsulimonadaceae bacterium]|nr:30S ribosomal protein S12 methylthiotransferase RimO [Capsulimonadaceae bacterium]
MTKVGLIQLGCPKNQVDAEEMLGAIMENGDKSCEIAGDKNAADVLIVNTCAFIDSAKEESVNAILDAVRLKTHGSVKRVIVTGCLAQRYGEDLAKEIPEVDAFLGVESAHSISNVVFGELPSQRTQLTALTDRYPLVPRSRARAGSPWTAYLKVSEGCDHGCTFCSIPSFRGRHRSKPIERLVAEATDLARSGARELCLIAQDTTAYGMDLYRRLALPELLQALCAVEGIDWLRLLYCYPTMVGDQLIETMARERKVLPYMDIPLQHGDDEMLKAMKRGGTVKQYTRLFERMREAIPNLTLRTTFIVGFPGETAEQFDNLMRFVDEIRFDRLGVFLYSKEENTPAALLADEVSRKIAIGRRDRLMKVQRSISREMNSDWIGREIEVLVERPRGEHWLARSWRDAPEIDGAVVLNGDAKPGEIVNAIVTGADDYDLIADATGANAAGSSILVAEAHA